MDRKIRKWWWLGLILACGGAIGPQGTPGNDGRNGLVSLAPEPAGTNCAAGGVAVKSGVDGNGNGALDASEVTGTSYVCNGSNGTSGSADTPAQVLAKLSTVDGAGSGLDADLIRGQPPAAGVPPGTVAMFAGDRSQLPVGWLLCDGTSYVRSAKQALFNAIGTNHGAADATHFNVPDYRGRFLRGVDYTAGRDPNNGTRTRATGATQASNEVGTFQVDATRMPTTPFTTDNPGDHTHNNGTFGRLLQQSSGSATTIVGPDATFSEPDLVNSQPEVARGAHTHAIASGGDAETRPANAYVNYIIKE